MVAFIHVKLLQGMFTSKKHLHDVMAMIYQNEAPLNRLPRTEGAQRYIADILQHSVYSCIPSLASQAWFLWLTEQEFLIVIQTFYQGNLLQSTGGIIHALLPRLKQLGLLVGFHISFQSPWDAQTYISGELNSLSLRLWDNLKDNFAGLIIAIVVAIIAKVWLNDYYHEALAVFIGLLLFSTWELFSVWVEVRKQPILWSIRHHG
jgi:hypothetical protein